MIKKELPYIIINETFHPTEGSMQECTELHHDNEALEMIAKMACTEIVKKANHYWAGFNPKKNKCIYVMPQDSINDKWSQQIHKWADEFPNGHLELDNLLIFA